ncbi:MAG TPA: hypothetical protein VI386_19725 [Candidatus Sulfotelmatobacter sp.]
MSKIKLPSSLWLPPALIGAMLISSCSVNVKKESNGQDKQVDINTLLGGIHVSKNAEVSDVGLPVYPGAHLKTEDSSADDKTANVNISGFGYGLKVVALEYESEDSPEKLTAFYKEHLRKYGTVLECHTSRHFDLDMKYSDKSNTDSHALTCNGGNGRNVELKVGTRENQHIVAIEPQSKGSSFSLVYVRTHGKDADI